jgi:hypothetical protein
LTSLQPFNAGRIKSVPSFEHQFDFEVLTGQDFFYIDADKSHARFNVNAIGKDANDVVHITSIGRDGVY